MGDKHKREENSVMQAPRLAVGGKIASLLIKQINNICNFHPLVEKQSYKAQWQQQQKGEPGDAKGNTHDSLVFPVSIPSPVVCGSHRS